MRVRPAPPVNPASQAFLDVIRVVAANLVLVEHATRIYVGEPRFSAATVGVTLFFLISGFLILISAWKRFERPDPGFEAFIIDRVCRIYTAFFPALLLAAVLAHLFVAGDWGQPGLSRGVLAFIGNALLLNDYPAFQVITRITGTYDLHLRSYNTAEQFWTIPIEFWIYVVFGFVAFCGIRQERLRGWIMPVLVGVGVPVVLWNAFAGGGNSLTLLWCLGAFFGYLFIQVNGQPRRVLVGALSMALCGAIALAGRVAHEGFAGYEVQTSLFVAMIVFGILGALNTITRPLLVISTFARVLASYSYSLYLIHNTVLIVFYENLRSVFGGKSMLVAILLSHAAAIALYWWCERHHKRVASLLKSSLLGRSMRRSGTGQAVTPMLDGMVDKAHPATSAGAVAL